MTKTIPEIDDEMIERYLRAAEAKAAEFAGIVKFNDDQRAVTRAGLTAALTEPEIEVTEAMIKAGGKAFNETRSILDTYRAMVKAAPKWPSYEVFYSNVKEAPKGAKSAPQGVNAAAPEKATGGGVWWTLDGSSYRTHHRATDRVGDVWNGKFHRRSTDPK